MACLPQPPREDIIAAPQQEQQQQQQQPEQQQPEQPELKAIIPYLQDQAINVMDENFEFNLDNITEDFSKELVNGGYDWYGFPDALANAKAEKGIKEKEKQRIRSFLNFVDKIKESCSVSLTDDELGALDEHLAALVSEFKGDMEKINEDNKESCKEAITTLANKIRTNAEAVENIDDALRTAVEEALGVFILFPEPRDNGERLENVKELLKMKFARPKERKEMSKQYREAYGLKGKNINIQLNKNPVVVHSLRSRWERPPNGRIRRRRQRDQGH